MNGRAPQQSETVPSHIIQGQKCETQDCAGKLSTTPQEKLNVDSPSELVEKQLKKPDQRLGKVADQQHQQRVPMISSLAAHSSTTAGTMDTAIMRNKLLEASTEETPDVVDGVQLQTVGFRSFEDRAHPQRCGRGWAQRVSAHPKPSAAGRAQRVPQGQHQRMNPDTAREMAQCTVVRLEKALEATGDVQAPAVEVPKTELTKAKSASKQPPFNVEIDQCRKYIARGERRIKELDTQRAEECGLLTEAQERLERWVSAQSRAPTVVHPQVSGEQVTSLQHMVNMLQSERDPFAKELYGARCGAGDQDISLVAKKQAVSRRDPRCPIPVMPQYVLNSTRLCCKEICSTCRTWAE